MPIVNKSDFGNFLKEAIPGRKRKLEQEPDPDPINGGAIDLLALKSSLQGAAQDLYKVDPLTEEEQQRYGELSNRAERLSPLNKFQYGELGSGRIGGNPYSIDTRGAARGLGNLIVGLANRERNKRRGEFEGELSDLTAQQQQNLENQDRQNTFFEKNFPGLVNEEGQIIRNREDNERMRDVSEADRQSKQQIAEADREAERLDREDEQAADVDMENLRHRNDVALAKYNNKNSGGRSNGLTGGERQGIAESLTAEGNILEQELSRLNKIAADPIQARLYNNGKMGMEQSLEQELENKVDRYKKIMKNRARINLDLSKGIEPDSDRGAFDPPPN